MLEQRPPSPVLREGCAGVSLSQIHPHFYTFPTKQLNRQFPFTVETYLSNSKSPYVYMFAPKPLPLHSKRMIDLFMYIHTHMS